MSNSTHSLPHQDATSQADAPPPAYTSTTSLPLPSYSSAASNTTATSNNNDNRTIPPGPRQSLRTRPTPTITIVLLGSPGVGKTTFLSKLPHVRNGTLQNPTTPSSSSSSSSSPSLNQQITIPNPTSFNVSLFARPYAITIHRSTSQLFIDPFPNTIDFVIYAYDVSSRSSLYNVQFYWRRHAIEFYEGALDHVPAMLVGLKRDLRSDLTETVDEDDEQGGGARYNDTFSIADSNASDTNSSSLPNNAKTSTTINDTTQQTQSQKKRRYVSVMPEEGLEAARNMRCDRYAECSALTGELMWEVLEDITRTAAMTTTSVGGRTQGECLVM